MKEVRYIHAADLHLDTPFTGLSRRLAPEAGEMLRQATFDALENLVRLCEREKPDFLLLAGDIYNEEERSIRAQLRLADACARLDRLNIPVFISHGNHDPLSSRISSINWPDNVKIFGPDPSFHLLVNDGEPYAIVHGASHATRHERRNLASLFKRDSNQACFQIGLLHCNVDGMVQDAPYASCSLQDLRNTGLDAWALGHAHKQQILSREPFIAYSGNTQGLHPGENGPKGCLLVTARHTGVAWQCEEQFMELAPVRWENMEINLAGSMALDDAAQAIQNGIVELTQKLSHTKGLLGSLTLKGATELDKDLRSASMAEHIRESCGDCIYGDTRFWLRKLDAATEPPNSQGDMADRDDLLGETARLAHSLEKDDAHLEAFMEQALKELFTNRRIAAVIPKPDLEEMRELAQNALHICQAALEER